ncbi:MAG TPA: GDSL-type esterase/lipase family protein, partial [Urbifossiella sp.]|jgi:lysophospholipase L1-like esterase|nr:GDSL-type esterase/lipase family protein [Urbifossiella sp.]
VLAAPAAAADPPAFPLRDGDVWVMAGDSITAQHLHSNYFEAFCYARYPKMKFAFRNSGVGGHTIPSTLARFDYDVAAWKPTVVSVELGMNDQGGTATDKFVDNMGTMVARIRKAGARPVVFSPSPINNGDTAARLGGNKRLDEYSTALRGFSEREKVPYADQFHALVDVWGKNKPREQLAATLVAVRQLAGDNSVEGVEHLRSFLATQDKSPSKPVSMQGDPVHPGPTGQLMMAAALLKALGADGVVSSVTVDAGAGKADAKGCTVTAVKTGPGGGSFDRLDECLPFPIPDDARAVLPLAPDVLALSRYTLAVTGLTDGDYILKIGGVASGRFTARQLAEGINLTALAPLPMTRDVNPIVAQMRAVLAAVVAKEALVGAWRGLSQKAHARDADPKLKDDLAALTTRVEAADAKIRDAARPQKLTFEVLPAPK